MSGSTPIEAGKVVPVSMLLHDRDDTKFIRAKIYDDTNALIATLSLGLVGGGLYSINTYMMPDINYIRVQYDVFNDVGFTSNSIAHGSDIDIFTNDRNTELLNAINSLLNVVQNVTGSLAQVEANISTKELEGAVSALVFDGDIEANSLEETISEITFTGEIDNDQLEGDIGCKK